MSLVVDVLLLMPLPESEDEDAFRNVLTTWLLLRVREHAITPAEEGLEAPDQIYLRRLIDWTISVAHADS